MTPEQRLNRVERILGLFIMEGRRLRQESREQNEKINILIQCQMDTTEHLNRVATQMDGFAGQMNGFAGQMNGFVGQMNGFAGQMNGFAEQMSGFTEQINRSSIIHDREMADLRKAQTLTDQSLRDLINAMRRDRNGQS